MSYFQIQTVLVVLALHIGARILFISYCLVFQIQLGFGVLALHIDAHNSPIYSYVILQTFQIQPAFLALALHIAAFRSSFSMLYFRFSLTSWSLVFWHCISVLAFR
jgi:hypothetical protein